MIVTKAIIKKIKEETPSIRWFLFEAKDKSFQFLPGQWLDLKPEGMEKWGGYSMMGPPSDLPFFELAIRKGKNHPTTKWLYEEAKVGDTVDIQGAGGKCFYSPKDNDQVILIMGGIGLTPLMSMARTFFKEKSLSKARMKIFYSVKNKEEWAFKDLLSELEKDERIQVKTLFSQEEGHLEKGDVFDSSKLSHYFLCGPPQMIEDLNKGLLQEGTPQENIHFEKWW